MRARSSVFLAVVVSLIACSGGGEGPITEPRIDPIDPTPMEPVAPVVRFPELLGASPVLEDTNADPNIVEVQLRAAPMTVAITGAELEMYAYNGSIPGPVLQAKVGDEVIIHFTNDLPEPTTIHWHGMRVPDWMDGSPRLQEPVPSGGTFEYRFVVPEAGTFWYHPHVRANEQLEKGLAGVVVIRDENDPEYDAERVIQLDDILLDGGSTMLPPFLASHPEVMHGRYGNVLLTNGRPSEQSVTTAEQGTVERWRLLNTANARTMELSITGATWRVVGTDGGLLPEPYTTERLIMPVGQRYEIEVTYDTAGAVELVSHVLTLNDAGTDVVEVPVPVHHVDVAASARTPRTIAWPMLSLPEREPSIDATIELEGVSDPVTGVSWRINGMEHAHEPIFTFPHGTTARIRISNMNGPEHPFHLHGQFFRIVDDGQPWTQQPGLKDTVLVPGLETVEIIAYLDNPGYWMAHCHILEHAQLGMMAEIAVEYPVTP